MTGTISGGGVTTARFLASPGQLSLGLVDQGWTSLPGGWGSVVTSYRFALVDGVSGEELGDLYPLMNPAPQLSHNASRTIKRSLTLTLPPEEWSRVDPVAHRIRLYMIINGVEYPLGRYLWADANEQDWWRQEPVSSMSLIDEGFIVDQPIDKGLTILSIAAVGSRVDDMIDRVLQGLPITYRLDGSPYGTAQSWAAGTTRGQILDSLALTGDYFSPWFDNNNLLRFDRIRVPSLSVPDVNYDKDGYVISNTVVKTSSVFSAPNRIIVIGSGASASTVPVVGIADMPPTSPISLDNRGYIVSEVHNLDADNQKQASIMAQTILRTASVYQKVQITTPPDPRIDGWNIVRWNDKNWLESDWSLSLAPGGLMNHSLVEVFQ